MITHTSRDVGTLVEAATPEQISPLVLEELRSKGWALVQEVSGIQGARKLIAVAMQALEPSYWLTSCAKRSATITAPRRLPTCPELRDLEYQALHFDMGAPIIAVSATSYTCLFAALFHPGDVDTSAAETRIVRLSRLFERTSFDDAHERLVRYATVYGDGWAKPSPARTGRLSCLARLIDAASDQHQLIDFYDMPTWDWFCKGRYDCGLLSETEYFREHGIDLKSVEERVRLKRGDLLIIDNIRCAHGRVGPRPLDAIYHVMVGLDQTTSETVTASATYLSRLLN
jgi:hypothetical protein